MEEIKPLLISEAARYGLEVSSGQAEQFQKYAELLIEWNKKINLTAITQPDEIVMKHFLDSILLLKYAKIPRGAKTIDIGTGAGFPGVPLLILRPDLRLTLLDSLNKRLNFLSDLLSKLGLNAELVHARAEEAGRMKQYRQRYDFAAARAVAQMPVLCEYCLPFLRQGGVFAAMKGPQTDMELHCAEKAIELLGCACSSINHYQLPGGDGRTLILIERLRPTPGAYPRQTAKISKQPL